MTQPVPGRPALLEAEVDVLARTARALLEATTQLETLTVNQTGEAITAAADHTQQVAADLGRSWRRYDGTRGALHVYSVELRGAHDSGASARSAYHQASQTHWYWDNKADELRQEMRHAAQNFSDPAELQRVTAEYHAAVYHRDHAAGEMGDAQRRLDRIMHQLDEAAEAAIQAIDDSFDGTNDGLLDHVGNALSPIGDILSWAADQFRDFVAGVIDGIVETLSTMWQYAMEYLALPLGLAAVGGIVALLFGAPGLVVLGLAIPALIGWSIYSERQPLKPPVRTTGPEPSYGLLHPKVDDGADSYYGALFYELGQLDNSGSEQSPKDTEIRVVAIRDALTNEIIGWRVEIPSTQDWSVWGTQLNDLRANTVLAMAPDVDTLMERAVIDAMARAGALDSDAPVMLAGWSQGGMTACEVAMNPALKGRVESIVTGGSPVDQYQYELSGVRMTSFTSADGVSGLEGARFRPNDLGANPNLVQYHDDGFLDLGHHGSAPYAEMADREQPQLRPGDEKFFGNPSEGQVETVSGYAYTR